MAQLATIASQSEVCLYLRCPYQATVMKVFEMNKSTTVFTFRVAFPSVGPFGPEPSVLFIPVAARCALATGYLIAAPSALSLVAPVRAQPLCLSRHCTLVCGCVSMYF